MSARLTPLPMTTIVTTDLIGITRGRSFPTDELEHYQAPGCGWVPANSALTPQDSIASTSPWGAYGDLRLVPDLSSRVTVSNGPDVNAPPLDFIHGDLRETDGQPFGACRARCCAMRSSVTATIWACRSTPRSNTIQPACRPAEPPAFSLKPSVRAPSSAAAAQRSACRGVEPEMFLPA